MNDGLHREMSLICLILHYIHSPAYGLLKMKIHFQVRFPLIFHCHVCSADCKKILWLLYNALPPSTCSSYFRDCSQLASSHVKKLDAPRRSFNMNITLTLNAPVLRFLLWQGIHPICFFPPTSFPWYSEAALAELRQEGDEVKNGAWKSWLLLSGCQTQNESMI